MGASSTARRRVARGSANKDFSHSAPWRRTLHTHASFRPNCEVGSEPGQVAQESPVARCVGSFTLPHNQARCLLPLEMG